MRLPITIAVVLLLAVGVAAEESTVFSGYDREGRQFEYRLDKETLAATPAWAPEGEPPPLAISAAVAAAKRTAKPGGGADLLTTEIRLSASLTEAGYRWFYLVSLYDTERAHEASPPPMIEIMILMDGSVVERTVPDGDR